MWFIIYFLTCGLILILLAQYTLSHKEEILQKYPKETEEFEEVLSKLDEISLKVNPYPFLYCLCMLVGWIAIPYVLISEMIKKF